MLLKESEKMYLETIYILSKKMNAVRSIDIAELNISRPTVSVTLNFINSN